MVGLSAKSRAVRLAQNESAKLIISDFKLVKRFPEIIGKERWTPKGWGRGPLKVIKGDPT